MKLLRVFAPLVVLGAIGCSKPFDKDTTDYAKEVGANRNGLLRREEDVEQFLKKVIDNGDRQISREELQKLKVMHYLIYNARAYIADRAGGHTIQNDFEDSMRSFESTIKKYDEALKLKEK